jgi:glycosyltransferase involved in cell wall biosynthesis
MFAGFDSSEIGDLRGPIGSTMRQLLERRVEELGVAQHARFLGQTGEMPNLYAAADVVAVPSWEEPFGFVAVEAMAASRPVVGTTGGGTPEVVAGDETGILVPPRDPDALAVAIHRLLGNPALARQMGMAGHRRAVSLFTVERYCRAFESVFAAVRKPD